jgi:uncharacterized phiE125 gp8 family phage protein
MYTPLTRRLSTAYPLPIDLEKLKMHLKVEGTEEDAYITDLACAASALWEERVRQAVMEAEYVSVSLNWSRGWEGLRSPITGIFKVEYVSEAGEVVFLETEAYTLSVLSPGGLYFTDYRNLPALSRTAPETVRMYYTAGATSVEQVPPLVRRFIELMVAHWYENRQPVIIGVSVNEIPDTAQALIDLEREPVL